MLNYQPPSELDPDQLNPDQLNEVFKALSDSSRRSMVERLSRGPATVTELAAPLDMSFPAVVQHLKVLEQCGIVATEKVGRVRTCQIRPAVLTMAEGWITERRAMWEVRLDRLGTFLEASVPPDDRSDIDSHDNSHHKRKKQK